MATSVRVLGAGTMRPWNFFSGFDWGLQLHWLHTYMYSCTYIYIHIYIFICKYICYTALDTYTDTHTCIHTQIHHVIVTLAFKLCIVVSGWFPKYVDQSGAPKQEGLFRGLAVTWSQGHFFEGWQQPKTWTFSQAWSGYDPLNEERLELGELFFLEKFWLWRVWTAIFQNSELLYGGDTAGKEPMKESTFFVFDSFWFHKKSRESCQTFRWLGCEKGRGWGFWPTKKVNFFFLQNKLTF